MKNNNLPKQLLAWPIPKLSKTLNKPEVLSWLRVGHTKADMVAGFSTRVGDVLMVFGIISLSQCL